MLIHEENNIIGKRTACKAGSRGASSQIKQQIGLKSESLSTFIDS
jgi:hypothetical protein